MEWHPVPIDTHDVSSSEKKVTQSLRGGGGRANIMDEYKLWVRKLQGKLQKNELERYMEDRPKFDYPGFDILNWWRIMTTRYHAFSRVARDILAIPVSSVSFEDAFSTGDHVLDRYHSCLDPTTVEALICSKSWLSHNLRKNWDSHQTFDVVQAERGMIIQANCSNIIFII